MKKKGIKDFVDVYEQKGSYTGDLVNGCAEGHGAWTSEGNCYQGSFKDDKQNGRGKLFLAE